MVEDGVEYVVMEVSSQSLKLHRVDGCAFDIVLFTNYLFYIKGELICENS